MRTLAVALFASLLALPAWALAAEDPPDRVARLSHIEGEVSMAPAGTQEWSEAVVNRPLTSEDRLFVDNGARAELQVDSALIHLDGATEFSFVDLGDDAMTMRLTQGRATIHIQAKREREDIEIDTPNASVALLHPGEYHVEVDEDGETTIVKVRSGAAEVAGEGDSFTVRANEIGAFRGADTLTADISPLGSRTAFEAWANERSRRSDNSASAKYVSEGVVGYEDLDDNGDWVHEPEYGYVWTPRYVVAGWAPYRYGRWAWVSPWGWTWIDDARWGYAPFHYGRWTYVSQRWCWVPGPRHVRAVYAPALVGWVGGPHVSIGLSFGPGVGWFPLGPREVYVPGYWHTHRYIQRVNVSNTIIVNNTYIDRAYRGQYRDFGYRYRDRPDAVTVVDREHFVRGRPIGGRAVRVDEGQLRRWGDDARPPAIAPERDSIVAGQPRMPRGIVADRDSRGRQFVARREPPARVSFDEERRAIEANGGRPVARAALVDRNPKARADVRIARGSSLDAQRRMDFERAGGVGRAPSAAGQDTPVQSLRAVEDERREAGTRGDVRRPREDGLLRDRNPAERTVEQRLQQQRETATRALRREEPRSDQRVERTYAPAPSTRERVERTYAPPAPATRERVERTYAPAPSTRERVERTYSTGPSAQPRIERRSPEPRVERAYSAPEPRAQPRVERSYSQPQRQAPPQRQSQPRAEQRSQGGMRDGRGGGSLNR